MYAYIKGMVTDIESTYIVVEHQGLGFMVYTPNPYSFELNKETMVYLYQYIREDEQTLYGFKTRKKKNYFYA